MITIQLPNWFYNLLVIFSALSILKELIGLVEKCRQLRMLYRAWWLQRWMAKREQSARADS